MCPCASKCGLSESCFTRVRAWRLHFGCGFFLSLGNHPMDCVVVPARVSRIGEAMTHVLVQVVLQTSAELPRMVA